MHVCLTRKISGQKEEKKERKKEKIESIKIMRYTENIY